MTSLEDRLVPIASDLVVRFRGCSLAKAQELVRSVASEFEGAPVQDYVPVLTAHICRERLRAAHSRGE